MRMKRNLTKTLVIALFLYTFTHGATADEIKESGDLTFDLAPFYLRAIPVDGDVAIGPIGDSVTLDFGDIFDNLQSAFIIHFETRYKEKYGLA